MRVIKTVIKQSEQSYRDTTFLRDKIYEFMADIRNLSDQLINKIIEVDHKIRIQ